MTRMMAKDVEIAVAVEVIVEVGITVDEAVGMIAKGRIWKQKMTSLNLKGKKVGKNIFVLLCIF